MWFYHYNAAILMKNIHYVIHVTLLIIFILSKEQQLKQDTQREKTGFFSIFYLFFG